MRVWYPYNTAELPVRAGEAVEVWWRDDASGWAWCVDSRGRQGWLPLEILSRGEIGA